MDFLEIRKKAKERAAARADERASRTPAEPATPRAPEAERPAPAPDELAGAALAERLQRLPPAAAELRPSPADARFTTWRPGSGAAPAVDIPPPPASEFAVFTPGGGTAALPPDEEAPAGAPAAGAAPGPARAAAAAVRAAPPPAAATSALDEFFYRDDEAAPEVPAFGLAPSSAEAVPAEPPALEEFLTFRLGGEDFGVRIEQVREVLRSPPITEVPRAPAHIVGVVTVRGDVVAVFDPRRRLGLPPSGLADGAARIVIVDAGTGPCGLLVDAVASVVRLPSGSIEPRPQGIGGARAECLAGIGRDRDRLFTVLDLAGLLRRPAGRPGAAPERGGRPHART